jgi:Resolvase, N terminal domain
MFRLSRISVGLKREFQTGGFRSGWCSSLDFSWLQTAINSSTPGPSPNCPVPTRENLDIGPLGRAVIVIVSAVAELERNLISERVRAGLRRAIGKVFVVVSEDVRKCLVCDGLFSRQASCEHAKVACYPYVPYVQPIGNQNRSYSGCAWITCLLGRDLRVCDVSGMA